MSLGTKFDLPEDSNFVSLIVFLDHTTSMCLKERDLENSLSRKFIQRRPKSKRPALVLLLHLEKSKF